ncbi:MAG: 3-methyl-2-oxobutanoate hydroxymethyltransferase [Planctomycetaceae bacterium]
MANSSSSRPAASVTVPGFLQAKQAGRKLSMLTAYDYLWAQLFDGAGVDGILVGDSLGMVVQGHSTTLPVTLEQMIYHAEIVTRAVKRALVVVDLPFMTYQVSPRQAVRNAGRILKETGAAAVKLENGPGQSRTIEALTNAELPVMAHVGMRPQSIRKLGKMSAIQRDGKQLLADAKEAQDAGAFAIVIELVPREIAAMITAELDIPTIGIGAGPECDGQVLVSPDMLGLTPNFHPRYLKKFADLHGIATAAVEQYVQDVTAGTYPDAKHSHQ